MSNGPILLHKLDVLNDPTWRGLREAAGSHVFEVRDERAGLRSSEISLDFDGSAWLADWLTTTIAPLAPGLSLRDVQLTRMVEGGYFGEHQDARYPGVEGAIVSFVYYLGDHDSFEGGLLRFATGETVGAVDNSLIVFDGLAAHEVTRVRGEGAVRLTINGYWGE